MFKKYLYIIVSICFVTTSTYAATNDLEKQIKSVGSSGRFTVTVLFDDKKSSNYNAMHNIVKKFADDNTSKVELIELNAGAEAASSIVRKYRLSRAPKPLTLVFAPNGAVTGGYAKNTTYKKLMKSLVGPIKQKIVKANQEGKPVIIKIPGKSLEQNTAADKAINDFKMLRNISPEVIVISQIEKEDKELKDKFDIKFGKKDVQLIVLATTGSVAGKFTGKVSAEEISEALKNSNSSCCSK